MIVFLVMFLALTLMTAFLAGVVLVADSPAPIGAPIRSRSRRDQSR